MHRGLTGDQKGSVKTFGVRPVLVEQMALAQVNENTSCGCSSDPLPTPLPTQVRHPVEGQDKLASSARKHTHARALCIKISGPLGPHRSP